MRPLSVVPQQVPVPSVRRLEIVVTDGDLRVLHLDVPRVPAPTVVPRPRTELRSA